MCVTKICVRLFERAKEDRTLRFALNERYYSPIELLYLKFTIFTIEAERGMFLLLQMM